jgi:hypothetical protein
MKMISGVEFLVFVITLPHSSESRDRQVTLRVCALFFCRYCGWSERQGKFIKGKD